MGVPQTTGQLRTNINEMQIGDYIIFSFYVGSLLVHELGTSTKAEMPLTGLLSSSGQTQSAYFVKVDKGLLVSDRVCAHTISWDTLNSSKKIQGETLTLNGNVGKVRSLTGGVSYLDANGNSSTTDKGLGAFPTNNEWDRYIVNFPTNKIQSGKTLDDVFHYDIRTWTQDTISSTIVANTNRIIRGRPSELKYTSFYGSSTSNNAVGFRPVFEYKE